MQEHEARSRTRGDRLGITDTPVCERFHGQRLWSPYTSREGIILAAVMVRIVGLAHSTFYYGVVRICQVLECAGYEVLYTRYSTKFWCEA